MWSKNKGTWFFCNITVYYPNLIRKKFTPDVTSRGVNY